MHIRCVCATRHAWFARESSRAETLVAIHHEKTAPILSPYRRESPRASPFGTAASVHVRHGRASKDCEEGGNAFAGTERDHVLCNVYAYRVYPRGVRSIMASDRARDNARSSFGARALVRKESVDGRAAEERLT